MNSLTILGLGLCIASGLTWFAAIFVVVAAAEIGMSRGSTQRQSRLSILGSTAERAAAPPPPRPAAAAASPPVPPPAPKPPASQASPPPGPQTKALPKPPLAAPKPEATSTASPVAKAPQAAAAAPESSPTLALKTDSPRLEARTLFQGPTAKPKAKLKFTWPVEFANVGDRPARDIRRSRTGSKSGFKPMVIYLQWVVLYAAMGAVILGVLGIGVYFLTGLVHQLNP